eukprot:m.78274 g.78274  ORF g.78274 m.78274 type:complete len:972 (+) comp20741_c0_seq1:72-2987(+)
MDETAVQEAREWIKNVERRAAHSAASSHPTPNHPFQDDMPLIPTDDVEREAKALLSSWLQHDIHHHHLDLGSTEGDDDLADVDFRPTKPRAATKAKTQASKRHRKQNAHFLEDDDFLPDSLMYHALAGPSLEHETVDDVLSRMMAAHVDVDIDPTPKSLRHYEAKKPSRKPPHLKRQESAADVQLRQKKAQQLREQKEKERKARVREKIQAKERKRAAAELLRKEEQQQAALAKLEERRANLEAARLKRELHERERKERELHLQQQKIQVQAGAILLREQQLKEKALLKEKQRQEQLQKRHEQIRKIQKEFVKEKKSLRRLKTLRLCFQSWRSLVAERHAKLRRLTAVRDFKLMSHAWNHWRSHARTRREKLEQDALRRALLREKRAVFQADNFYSSNLLAKTFVAWQVWARRQHQERELQQQQEQFKTRRERLLRLASQSSLDNRTQQQQLPQHEQQEKPAPQQHQPERKPHHQHQMQHGHCEPATSSHTARTNFPRQPKRCKQAKQPQQDFRPFQEDSSSEDEQTASTITADEARMQKHRKELNEFVTHFSNSTDPTAFVRLRQAKPKRAKEPSVPVVSNVDERVVIMNRVKAGKISVSEGLKLIADIDKQQMQMAAVKELEANSRISRNAKGVEVLTPKTEEALAPKTKSQQMRRESHTRPPRQQHRVANHAQETGEVIVFAPARELMEKDAAGSKKTAWLPTKPMNLRGMEERAARRNELKRQREERQKQKEEQKKADLERQRQAELEAIEEEKRQRREKRKEEQRREKEKQEELERRRKESAEKRARADQHHRQAVIKFYGWRPWVQLIQSIKQSQNMAEEHHNNKLKRKAWALLCQVAEQRQKEREQIADNFRFLKLARRVWDGWLEACKDMRYFNDLARRQHKRRLLGKTLTAWRTYTSQQVQIFAVKDRMARLHYDATLKKRCLLLLRENVVESKKERKREARRKELRAKVASWLPDYEGSSH